MSVCKTAEGIRVHQSEYIDTLVEKFQAVPGAASTSPTGPNFLQDNDKDVNINSTKYLGLIMSLMYMYLARFTRPDVLMPVTFLATKSANPMQSDDNKGMKILSYLMGTKIRTLFFKASAKLTLEIFADAAHMIQRPNLKFKLVTRSSTESEMVCLEESVIFALWMSILLRDFYQFQLPVTIYQDNLSTIGIVMNGGSFNRSKHMISKYAFVKQNVDLGKIQLVHCRTQVMVADMLTKPLGGSDLKKLCDLASTDL
jgi:hypothetical protein